MVTPRSTTAIELLALGSDAPFELIQGAVRQVSPSSFASGRVGRRLLSALDRYVEEKGLGELTLPNTGFLLEQDPDSVVAPNIGFIRSERIPDPEPPRGFFPGRPDLAVEIVSPTDEREDIERKQALYDRAGVPLVWWIDPQRKTAFILRAGEEPVFLDATGVLDGVDVIPGFSLPLERIFSR